MRKVVLGMRWLAVLTAAFFLFALFTGTAVQVATTALVLVVVAVIIVSVVDLAARRR